MRNNSAGFRLRCGRRCRLGGGGGAALVCVQRLVRLEDGLAAAALRLNARMFAVHVLFEVQHAGEIGTAACGTAERQRDVRRRIVHDEIVVVDGGGGGGRGRSGSRILVRPLRIAAMQLMIVIVRTLALVAAAAVVVVTRDVVVVVVADMVATATGVAAGRIAAVRVAEIRMRVMVMVVMVVHRMKAAARQRIVQLLLRMVMAIGRGRRRRRIGTAAAHHARNVAALLMGANVPVHVAVGGERQVAVFAVERPFAGVHEHVAIERRGGRQHLGDMVDV